MQASSERGARNFENTPLIPDTYTSFIISAARRVIRLGEKIQGYLISLEFPSRLSQDTFSNIFQRAENLNDKYSVHFLER